MDESVKKLIDKNIIKKDTILTLKYLKKNMDSVTYVEIEDDFIVTGLKQYDIKAMCINDRFPINVDIDNILAVDGMDTERLLKAFNVKESDD